MGVEISLLSSLVIGFILGIKHAIEPDHVIAVSTIASHSKSLWRSALYGVFWGIGHTATLLLIGILFILMKGEIPDVWAMSLEFTVGIMLVYLGVSNLIIYHKKKAHIVHHEHGGHPHTHLLPLRDQDNYHNKKEVSYLYSTMIGFVHGLAGSAAMILLTMGAVTTVWEGGLYIITFGAGTVIGMLLFTTIIGIPFVLSKGKASIHNSLARLTGFISTAYGFYYMYSVGISDGLFLQWF